MIKKNFYKKILINLSPYKFTSHDYKIREYDLLERKFKIKVVIHDLSNILYPKANYVKANYYPNSLKFRSLEDWKKHLNKYKKKKNVIILNDLNLDSFNSLKIHNFLKKFNFNIILDLSVGVIDYDYFSKNFKEVFLKIKKLFIYPSILLVFLKKKILNFLFFFISFKKVIILYQNNYEKPNVPYRIEKKKFLKTNSKDYSNFLIYKKKNKLKKYKPIIFLDCPEPFFKGEDEFLYNYKKKIDNYKWYKDYNNFFDLLESFFSTKVIIIPHPKVKGIKNPYYEKKRIVNHEINAAAKLIPSSLFVMSGVFVSTAISYAIASYKPIFLIYNNQAKLCFKKEFIHQKKTAKKINCGHFNTDEFNKNEILKKLKINRTSYEKYKYEFLTSKNLIKKKNHDIMGELINSTIKLI